MALNPIPINAIFHSLEQYFSDIYINKLKSEFKVKDKDEFFRFNQRWDEKLEILHYDEDRNVLVPVQESFSDYIGIKLQNEVSRIRELYAQIILTERTNEVVFEYTEQFDKWLAELENGISQMDQLQVVKNHLKESIINLRKANNSIKTQCRNVKGPSHEETLNVNYSSKKMQTNDKIKVFKNIKPEEPWTCKLAVYLIAKKVIALESNNSFIHLFEVDGLSSQLNIKIVWTKESELNHKSDTGSIYSLLDFLVENEYIEHWGKNIKLIEIVRNCFVDKNENPINLSSPSISKNRNKFHSKFPDLESVMMNESTRC